MLTTQHAGNFGNVFLLSAPYPQDFLLDTPEASLLLPSNSFSVKLVLADS